MGYSCSAKADYVLKELIEQLKATGNKSPSSNGFCVNRIEYFYEIGKENKDGAITGTINRIEHNSNMCHKAGNFRIESNGFIKAFPHSTKAQRDTAMKCGLIKFHATHKSKWNDDELLTSLIGKKTNFVVI